ncbi:MAG: HD domain-containing protein, partial [Deltaproteobacteria bacterium]
HAFNVTRIALGLVKNAYHDPVGYIPVVIIAALGHDIGKIPELRNQDGYVKADHPRKSVSIIEGIFEKDAGAHWLKVATRAIGEHHQSATEPLSVLLKEADSKARQMEIEQAEKRASLSWEEWFDCSEFLGRVETAVNVIQTGSPFRAFSMEETVYCDPTFLYETARAMAAQKNVEPVEKVPNGTK